MTDPNELTFLRVIEAGSIKAAAEQLGTDPSVASRRIGALETRLGVRLLQRSTRRSTPTEAGSRYYEGLRRIVDQQLALESQVAGLVDTPTGRLRVAAPVDFGARFVAPVVAHIQAQYPDLAIDLVLGSSFTDLTESAIDVAVRVGTLPDSSLIARRIGVVPRVIVASKGFITEHGTPTSTNDLSAIPFIFYGSGQRELDIVVSRGEANETVRVSGSISVNSVTAIRHLVLAGRGLHLGPAWAFEEGLASGELAQILPQFGLPAFPLHALYPASSFVPAKTRLFIERFAEAMHHEPSIRTSAPD